MLFLFLHKINLICIGLLLPFERSEAKAPNKESTTKQSRRRISKKDKRIIAFAQSIVDSINSLSRRTPIDDLYFHCISE